MSEPLLLALETATAATGVALLRGERVVAERDAPPGRASAEALLPEIDALLDAAGVTLDSVEAFAVSIGPGSFTSLRVGLATVKGLAFGTERPVVAVPTLAALARAAAPGPGPVVAVLDARRGEVYAAAFEDAAPEPRAAAWLPEGLYGASELARRCPAPCRVVGEGVAVCAEALRGALGSRVALAPPPAGRARARHVGALGARCLARGEGGPAADLVPRYLRRAEAEARRTGLPTEPEEPRDPL